MLLGLLCVLGLAPWLPGAEVERDPKELDVQPLLSADGSPTHVSAIAELEQLGWSSTQGELLLLPVFVGGQVRRLFVAAGPVESEIEAMLSLVCRAAGAVFEQMAA